VRDLPRLILTVLGLLAAAALLHRLVVTGRAQRRELAVLRSVGFTTRQLATAGGTEGVSIVALALVAAVPLGLLAAVVGWRRIADYLAVVPDADAAAVATVVVAVAAVIVGGMLGLWMALRRRRDPAGVLLRSE
jgi:ABC-type antimicrobial peptide transport system permease subunit